jgi:hypothetical protein
MNQSQTFAWRHYLDFAWGIEPIAEDVTWREYRIRNPSGAKLIARSMLMRYEIAMLYAVARDYYTGAGAIVDAGPLIGITTNALAKGVVANPAGFDTRRRIYSFDLFDHIPGQEVLATVPSRNRSVFDSYIDLNREYLDHISVVPGDLLRHAWDAGPIEVLFVDLAKSWALNEFVVDNWFTSLVPGAYVLQQDYFSWMTYWLPLTMMALGKHFEFVDYAMGGTAVFRCTKTVPPGMGGYVRSLAFADQEELMNLAVASAPLPGAQVIKAAQACFYLAHRMRERCREVLETIVTESLVDDLAVDFYGVARGSRDAVRLVADMPEAEAAMWVLGP